MTEQIGFVGLGRMGRPMAARLVHAGHDVRGFDTSPDARSAAEAAGIGTAADVGDAVAGTALVILMLPDSDAVSNVLAELGHGRSLRPGTTVVDMSSSRPDRTRDLGSTLEAQGVSLVDAPVSGGVQGAIDGTLTIMVGGLPEHVDRVEPVLGSLGRVVRAGPLGAGHAVKALNNLLSATHLWVTSEVMTAGERFGLDPEVMLSVFNGSSGRSGSTETKWPKFILPGTFASGFGLQLMLKDIRIAVGLAAGVGARSRLGEEAVALWSQAADDLPATADHTEVARWIAETLPARSSIR